MDLKHVLFFKVERYFYNCQAEVFEKFHKSPDSRDDQGGVD